MNHIKNTVYLIIPVNVYHILVIAFLLFFKLLLTFSPIEHNNLFIILRKFHFWYAHYKCSFVSVTNTMFTLVFLFGSTNIKIVLNIFFPCFSKKILKFIITRIKPRKISNNFHIYRCLANHIEHVAVISFCSSGQMKKSFK